MKLIYIRSTMEPKNYSTIRSILKKEQGEKIAPYIFKINTQALEAYLRKERITYEIYQEERKIINIKKRKQNESILLPNKRQKQELLDKIKQQETEIIKLTQKIEQLKTLTPQELVNKLNAYETENEKLKNQLEQLQQNGQLTAQIEIKETKK